MKMSRSLQNTFEKIVVLERDRKFYLKKKKSIDNKLKRIETELKSLKEQWNK